MFELDTEINSWFENLRSSGHLAEADTDELKDHLYCEIKRQQDNGLSIEQAFTIAVNKLGNTAELHREYSISLRNPVENFQLVGGNCMRASKATFDLYLVCTVLFGWIFFTWITRLLQSLESGNELESVLISVLYLAVVAAALVASAVRKPLFLLLTSVICFVFLGVFMLETDYWWFWTQLNTGVSLLCVLFSIYIQIQHRNELVQIAS